MITAEEVNDRQNAQRRAVASLRAQSASGIASFQPAGRPALKTHDHTHTHAAAATDGGGDGSVKKLPLSSNVTLPAGAIEHVQLRKLQPRSSATFTRPPYSPPTSLASSTAISTTTASSSSSSFVFPSSRESSSPSSTPYVKHPASSATLPGPMKPSKPPKQDYSTLEFLSNPSDPNSPTIKPLKPPKLEIKHQDSSVSHSTNNSTGNTNSGGNNPISTTSSFSNTSTSNSNKNINTNTSTSTPNNAVTPIVPTNSSSASDLPPAKPSKPAKSGPVSPVFTAHPSEDKPHKPPKSAPLDSLVEDSPSSHSVSSAHLVSILSASCSYSCCSPTSSSKPLRPKRVTDDDPSTPKAEERESLNKPRLPPHTRPKAVSEDEEGDFSTCSSGGSGRASHSKVESVSSLVNGDSLNTISRLDPVEGATSGEDDDDDDAVPPSDATYTNKYGVTVMTGKALKVLGVNTPSGAVGRPGAKSPMHVSKPNNLISSSESGGNANVIHYTSKAASLFTDYDFKHEDHQILTFIRQGKTSAVCAALLDCSIDQFCKLIPVVACAIAETPSWATEVGEQLVAAIKQRVSTSPAINQAVHFLKISRLLDYPWAYNGWLGGLQTSSYLLDVCELLATREVGFEFKVPEGKKLFHPFQAGFTISSWQVTKIFNSNAKPRLVVPSGRLEEKTTAANSLVTVCGNPFIIKYGDDVRQDVAVVHIMCMMNNLWASSNLTHEGCPVKSLAYGCLALSDTVGCIEFVPNAVPLRLVSQAGRYSSTALNRMITSGAGSFVAAYILGVRDRHFDNILVSKHDGALFHIDFGRILGDQTTIDTGAFAITPDLKDVISSFGDDKWEIFVQLCLIAYKTIRDNSRLIISFTAMLMAPFQSQETVRNFIAQRLRLNLEDEVAMAKIRKKVSTAPTRWKTKFKNVVHGIATGD